MSDPLNDKHVCSWCLTPIQYSYSAEAIYEPTRTAENRKEGGPDMWMHPDCIAEAVYEALEVVPSAGRDKRPSTQRPKN